MATWQTPDGAQIHFELYGEQNAQRVLVLLNGWMGSLETHWRQFIDPLAADFVVLTLDFRGHGRSTSLGPRLTLSALIEDFIGLLDHLNIGSIFVSGYGLGGYVALQTALHHPRRLHTLHLHSTKPVWSREALERMRPQFDPDHLSRSAPTFANQLAQEHGASRWRALARESFDLMAQIQESPLPDHALRQLDLPVLVSVGDQDEIVSIPDAARLVFRLRNAGLLVLPQTRRPLPTVPLIPLVPMMQEFHKGREA